MGAAFVEEEAAGKVVDAPATSMEEDNMSELTGLGAELMRQMAASRCASEDGSVGGPMCASYASSQASDAGKTRPSSPEAAWPGNYFPFITHELYFLGLLTGDLGLWCS